MESNTHNESELFTQRMINTAIKLGALFLMLSWCFDILKPFLLPITWAMILAVALNPLSNKVALWLGGRKALAASLITLLGIALIVLPMVTFSSSAIDSYQQFSQALEQGSLDIPEPNESVKGWPIVGEKLYLAWQSAAADTESFMAQYAEQIGNLLKKILTGLAGIGGTLLQFIVSFIIAGVFIAKSESCEKGVRAFFCRLIDDERGHSSVNVSIQTIRSVAQGILGIAATQALLAGAGLVIADIPAAGIWVLCVLLLAIVQLPPIIILGPIAAYYFSVAETTPAVIFLVWSLIVSASDGFLKPFFLGRGMKIPMLVILLGAIGGMIWAGIIGLFIGAVILALGYQLLIDWIEGSQSQLLTKNQEKEDI